MTIDTGNNIDVDLTPDIVLLHDAGYHVLAYDLRNFGLSSGANGGLTSGGIHEARDVIGSLRYVDSRPDLHELKIALFSRCLGANATLFAMERAPREFEAVRCLVACQPLSPRYVLERSLERTGVPRSVIHAVDQQIRLRTSFGLDDMSPLRAASIVQVPALVYQVRDDLMTRPVDVQAIFDAIPQPDTKKKLVWIDGTTRRWDGYLQFQRHPDVVLDWLNTFTR
ncbi:alpha/beta hydrolase family protein [Humibacter antri]